MSSPVNESAFLCNGVVNGGSLSVGALPFDSRPRFDQSLNDGVASAQTEDWRGLHPQPPLSQRRGQDYGRQPRAASHAAGKPRRCSWWR